MYTPSLLKKSVYSALVFFGTLIVLSIGYSLAGNLSTADKVGAGSGLTATSWNRIIDGVLDLSTRLTTLETSVGWGPAGEAIKSPSLSVPSGGNTFISGFTVTTPITVGGWFNPTTGVFQPTVAGRYLFTIWGYSWSNWNWAAGVTKNNTFWVVWGAVPVPGNGNIATTSYVFNLNGSSDFVNFAISNYSWVTVSLSQVIVTWTKLP